MLRKRGKYPLKSITYLRYTSRLSICMAKLDQLKTLEVQDRAAWRKWLSENYDTSPGVFLVIHKKAKADPALRHPDAVKEALCFGWIDSATRKRDEEGFLLMFSPRRPRSIWSKLNKGYIEELIAEGLMTPAGLAKIEAAKKDGSWDTLNDIDNLKIPADLKKALAANKEAKKHFDAFSPSARKVLLFWLQSAKRPETRENRLREIVEKAALNQKANEYVKKT